MFAWTRSCSRWKRISCASRVTAPITNVATVMKTPMITWKSSTPVSSSRLSRRSRLRTSFGPEGGLVPMNSIAHMCRLRAARVRWANAPRSARQSPDGSGTSISASIASSIRSSSSSLEATYQ